MTSPNRMNKSSMRGTFLSTMLLFSVLLLVIIIPSNAYAEEINAKSVSLEETTIMEITNDSDKEVVTLRIWLGSGFNFESFKTESGWVGEKTPQGVIVFTSSDPIKSGESVKFGIKTDKAVSGINWKALDGKNTQLSNGKVLSKEITEDIVNSDGNGSEQNSGDKSTSSNFSISSESNFRIIPENPNVGSSIRVTGDKFGTSQEFDFYIDSKKIGSFTTDENGHFITTMKISDEQKTDRVDFKVKAKDGEEKKISLRIGESKDRIADIENIDLTVKGISDIMHRGESLEIFGTGSPGSAITATITTPEGEIINTRTAEVNSKGEWELEDPIVIPLDTPFGEYSITVTDGRQDRDEQWMVESNKVIIIEPFRLKFDQGDVMRFNGTALPNQSIEIIIEDPLGKEVFSDIFEVDESGLITFEYETVSTSMKGTYTIITAQGKHIEFTYTGLGQLPVVPVNMAFDQLNYKVGDIATISMTGKASEIVSLLIIDPSDKPIGDSISITLQPDGTATHELDLSGYASGAYTAVLSKGNSQSSEIFTVGLQTGAGDIEIKTTRLDYLPGDGILILGDTSANVLLTITLMDPEGSAVKEKVIFSDKNGKISESSFRIPSDGKSGMWSLNAKSGSNFDNIEIKVLSTVNQGMAVTITEGIEIPGLGKTIQIQVNGAEQTVKIEIISVNGEIIDTLSFVASKQGEINQPWIIPKETEPGIYTIRVEDAFNSAENSFEIR